MNVRQRGAIFFGAIFFLLTGITATTSAQRPTESRDAASPTIVVTHVVRAQGRVVTGTDPETKQPFVRCEGRQVSWRIGEREFPTLEAMRRELARLADDPATRCDDPVTGGKRLMPMRFDPDPATHWQEVLQVHDTTIAAGFHELAFRGAGTDFVMPMAIERPVVDARDLVVPQCLFCEPDEFPLEGRPTVDLRRDGRITHERETLYAWRAGQAEDLSALRRWLRDVRKGLAAAGEVEQRPDGDGTRITMPILVRADGFVQWRDAQRLLRELTAKEVGFWKLQVAVADKPPR